MLIVDDTERRPPSVREKIAAFGGGVADVPVLALVLDPSNGALDGDGLVLTPLDVGAVRAIVTRYAPEDAGERPARGVAARRQPRRARADPRAG